LRDLLRPKDISGQSEKRKLLAKATKRQNLKIFNEGGDEDHKLRLMPFVAKSNQFWKSGFEMGQVCYSATATAVFLG
jgi:hypothetical protein